MHILLLQLIFVFPFLVLHMDRLDIANTPDQYSFPNYDLGDLQQIQGSWGQPMDSLTFPKNFFDYTTRGKEVDCLPPFCGYSLKMTSVNIYLRRQCFIFEDSLYYLIT